MTSLFPVGIAIEMVAIFWMAPAGETDTLFPEIEGWKRSGNIQVFTSENLFDYIDGAAELYLNYDFHQLQVAEYQDQEETIIAIEIYRHKTPLHAFGIYSQERLKEGSFLDIGAQGYVKGMTLNFIIGPYYVKINAYLGESKTQEVLQHFGKKVAEQLGGTASLPGILSCFPEKRKIPNSERFVVRDFLGHRFLHHGFTADYGDSNRTFTLFIIEGVNSEDCAEMLQEYFQLTGYSQMEAKEGHYILQDPYHGELALIWAHEYLWGAINLLDDTLRSEYLQLTWDLLKKHKEIK
jgi:hypothetical protein